MLNPSNEVLGDVELGKAPGNNDLDWMQAPLSNRRADGEVVGLLAPSAPFPTTLDASPNPIAPSLCGVFSVAFYRQYFDVDTVDIVNRIQSAGWPFGAKPFLDVAAGNPDLYGPFWLCTTLVFIIGVTSNILSWLNITDDRPYQYDLSLMTMAGVLVFSYVSVVPLVLWSAFKYYSISIGLAQLLCLYGYAVLTFIPAALSCLFGLSILDWLALLAAVGISTKLLVDNTLPAVTAQLPTMGRAGVAAIAGVQIFFGLVLKLYFFRHE